MVSKIEISFYLMEKTAQFCCVSKKTELLLTTMRAIALADYLT